MSGLFSCGKKLSTVAEAFSSLSDSNDLLGDWVALRNRMTDDGYLLLRDFFKPDAVMAARQQVVAKLDKENLLDPAFPPVDAVAAATAEIANLPDANAYPAVGELVHGELLGEFFTEFLGGQSRHLDHIWMRIKSPGEATAPHYDIVYMGRGTTNIFTAWVPLGDVSMRQGALMILEKSHQLEDLKATYGQMDVDRDGNWKKWRFRHLGLFRGGRSSKNPKAVQREFGLRWLSTDFRIGDVCIFTPFTMHGTLDNQTDRIRITADTRYQLASDPVDERWVGNRPIGHSHAE